MLKLRREQKHLLQQRKFRTTSSAENGFYCWGVVQNKLDWEQESVDAATLVQGIEDSGERIPLLVWGSGGWCGSGGVCARRHKCRATTIGKTGLC